MFLFVCVCVVCVISRKPHPSILEDYVFECISSRFVWVGGMLLYNTPRCQGILQKQTTFRKILLDYVKGYIKKEDWMEYYKELERVIAIFCIYL